MDIDFLFFDEIKQKVERPLEYFQFHFVIMIVHAGGVVEDERVGEAIFRRCDFTLAFCSWMMFAPRAATISLMDPESTNVFNDRLAQWVAKQGFWFQMRYSMAGGGTSVLMYHVLRLLLKVLIFALILGAIALFFLIKRTDQASFKTDLRNQIVSGLDAEWGVMRNFSRSQNRAMIRHLVISGGADSYLDQVEATGVRFRMGLLDGFNGRWKPNAITVERMALRVKAGAETAEDAAKLGNSLTKSFDKVQFQNLESSLTSISWGYSERTRGSITGSKLLAMREGKGWRLQFTGGVFEQNWLRNMQIKELVLVCNDQGLVVEKGEFEVKLLSGGSDTKAGKVSFRQVKIAGGPRPEFSGSVRLENVPLEPLLQESYHSFVDGRLSGELKLYGSTNSPDGVSMTGRLSLNEGDSLSLRSRLPLLNSLAILSPSGSFRKVLFNDGYFTLKTTGGTLTISDIALSAPEQMGIRGGFSVRPLRDEEIIEMVKKDTIAEELAGSREGQSPEAKAREDQITLSKAAQLAQQSSGKTVGFADDSLDLGTPFQAESIQQQAQARAAEKMATTARYDGALQLTLPLKAFPANAPFLDRFSKTPNGESLVMDVPLRGSLLEITTNQAEEMLSLERKAPASPQ